MDYEIGQKLWYVSNDKRYQKHAHEVTITAIGRKWLTINDKERVDKNTLSVDGGQYSSPATCFLSQQVYENKVALDDAWTEFIDLTRSHQWRTPDGVTIETIRQAKQLLFGDKP